MRIRVLHALYARYLNHDTLKAPQEPWNAMALKGLILVLMEDGLWHLTEVMNAVNRAMS